MTDGAVTVGALAAGLAAAAVLAWPRPGGSIRDSLGADAASGRLRAPFRPWVHEHGARRRSVLGAATALRRGSVRGRDQIMGDVLAVLDVVAAALHTGAAPGRAVALAVGQLPEGSAVRSCLVGESEPPRPHQPPSRVGPSAPASSIPEAWRVIARSAAAPEVDFVARAWELSEALGAPLAPAVDLAAASVRRARDQRSRVDAAMAGPRATMRLLTSLPLVGPFVGWALGFDPVGLYWQHELTRLVTLAGLALLTVGWLWCRALVRRVCRP